jgi:asparagine synthase (glutamine-hydrolysing)
MCGIAGIVNIESGPPPADRDLRQMLAMIRHRGPDQFGIYRDADVALGNARLSIIDLSSGQQPICNEDGTLWIVFNGEIFNYVDLRPDLEARGHRFVTNTDTEVILHLFEEQGPGCLDHLNGQFAIAIWDSKNKSLFLARDRVGVRPVFYTLQKGRLLFGSEIKVLLSDREVPAELDPVALDQVFTYWSALSPRTAFKDIYELPPGHYMRAEASGLTIKRYWEIRFPSAELSEGPGHDGAPLESYIEELSQRLIDATRIRLRADVPVGAYLSGGLDSSLIAHMVRHFTGAKLDTFSIAFDDPGFDESQFQRRMAECLGTQHHVVRATHADIGAVFPEVIWHTETPLMRTAPAPMFLLSKMVHEHGYKVVLTGEGADEFLAGYDIFKEAMVRQFCARQPESKRRPLLFQRLYPDIRGLGQNPASFLTAFFGKDLDKADEPGFSHAIRWQNTRRARRFFTDDLAVATRSEDGPWYPPGFQSWGRLGQAQYLEATIFLPQYLLSSQGDRPAMAHAVEGRFPFLDYRVIEYCNRLPSRLKLRGLTEKYLLKKIARNWLPEEIWKRPKRPYRAPIHRSFFNNNTPDYVLELLSNDSIARAGLFKPTAVDQLVRKLQQGAAIGETDDMALAGILSSQLVHRQFIEHFAKPAPLSERDDVKECTGPGADGKNGA